MLARERRGEGRKGIRVEAVRLKLTLLSPPTAVPEMAAARLHAVGLGRGVCGLGRFELCRRGGWD
jgi:hypothetical protein